MLVVIYMFWKQKKYDYLKKKKKEIIYNKQVIKPIMRLINQPHHRHQMVARNVLEKPEKSAGAVHKSVDSSCDS